MYVQKLDSEKLFKAYNVDLQMLYPVEGVVEPPFGAAWAILAPGEATKHHQHQELETFFVVRGQGLMTVNDESTAVEQGSVVFHRPFHQHVLQNTSDTEDLLFLTVWWEDRKQWVDGEAEADGDAATDSGPKRVMVTAAPPTPNGDLHLGHLSGPYLSADYYTRYLRQRGVDAHYACGSDDHCMYVERMGEQIGMSGEQAADHFVASIRETLDAAGANMTVFMDPRTSPHFQPLVHDLFDRLWSTGKLELREAPAPYCEGCARYLFEADIAGECPHCGSGVTGNTCEDCGGVNDSINLVATCCTACKQTPAARPFTRLVFPLGQWTEQLRAYHRSVSMNPHLRAFCEKTLAQGLPDVAISHPSGWGIPVPMAGSEEGEATRPADPALAEQTLYVWFEMAARYFAYASHINESTGGAQGYDNFWRADDAEIVQFFGYDNSFYYSILLPAFYMAYDSELRLPTAFVINEFYRLDGEKFSTSRDHRILGRDMAAAVPRDVMRYYLAHSCPEQEETNFTSDDFAGTVNRELRKNWRPWLADLGTRVAQEYDGKVPSTGDWTADQRHFFDRLYGLVGEAEEAYTPATFSPQRVSRLCGELVRTAKRFAAGEAHWVGVPDREQERRTSVALELLAAKTLAFVIAPVMPTFAAELWQALGFTTSVAEGSWESTPSWVPSGQPVGDLAAALALPAEGQPLVLRPTRDAG